MVTLDIHPGHSSSHIYTVKTLKVLPIFAAAVPGYVQAYSYVTTTPQTVTVGRGQTPPAGGTAGRTAGGITSAHGSDDYSRETLLITTHCIKPTITLITDRRIQ